MALKAVFLDRDETLIEDPGYINTPDQVVLLDGVGESLVALRKLGYKLVIVSNQSGVARGIVTEKVLGEIHDRLGQLLAEKGAFLDGIYYCPYHPDGVVDKYRKESELRKPNPGMLLAAAKEMDLDLDLSWLIGNSARDIEAGARAGCKTILIAPPTHRLPSQFGRYKPDHNAVNMKEAVNIIKKHHRSSDRPKPKTQPSPELPPKPLRQNSKRQQSENHAPVPQDIATEGTEQLLKSILEQLRVMRREDMFAEFSLLRLTAGIVQVIVLFCLGLSAWILTNPKANNNSALITLAFALVFQMMALTLYMMQGRK